MFLYVFVTFACTSLCFAQLNTPAPQEKVLQNELQTDYPTNLHTKLSEAIGNFSLELLYATALQDKQKNLILSPLTVWTGLAVTAEGALRDTRKELNRALRISANRALVRERFQEIAKWLFDFTSTIQHARFNGLFVHKNITLESDLQQVAKSIYDTHIISVDVSDTVKTATQINQAIASSTRNKIPKVFEASDLVGTIIASAAYFKGLWTSPFNVSSTSIQPFYNSNGTLIGVVNMMYSSFTYPFANIKDIQARVIELPYGKENRLSMLMMLPNPGVTLQDMFLNFKKVPLDIMFAEMQRSQEEYSEDDVACFIPRFKIESNLNLTEVLNRMGIYGLFDPQKANLGRLARFPTYVTKVIHKAEIDVIEEGTTPSAEMAATIPNRNRVVRFEANRPFCYLIVEKVTNTILFGGVYQQPILY